jgi:hypothetical protein
MLDDLNKKHPFVRLVHFLRHMVEHEGYRRYKNDLCRQILVLLIKTRGERTREQYITLDDFSAWSRPQQDKYDILARFHSRAWVKECSMTEFVSRSVREGTGLWEDLHASSGLPRRVSKYLEDCPEIMDLKPDRLARAFRNGILTFDRGSGVPRFHAFETSSFSSFCRTTPVVCCKYYDQDFDPNCLVAMGQFMDIPTPTITTFLNFQGIDMAAQEMVFALLGRLLYKTNDQDKWNVTLFIKGVKQSGKSGFGDLVQQFFDQDNVAVISPANTDHLDDGTDTFLFVCYDVTRQWKLPALRSGTPGFFIGTELGQPEDATITLSRRLLVCEFNKRFSHVNPDWSSKLKAELPALIVKCQQAYMALISKCADRCIWECVPDYFKRTQRKFETNPIKRFLAEPQQFKVGEGLKTPLFEFGVKFREYLLINKICFKWNRANLESALEQAQLKLIEEQHEDLEQKGDFTTCIHGLSLK